MLKVAVIDSNDWRPLLLGVFLSSFFNKLGRSVSYLALVLHDYGASLLFLDQCLSQTKLQLLVKQRAVVSNFPARFRRVIFDRLLSFVQQVCHEHSDHGDERKNLADVV